MKNFIFAIVVFIFSLPGYCASSMFDDDGNYSGNWKQMTEVNTSYYSNKYYRSSSSYGVNKAPSTVNKMEFQDSLKMDVVPFRYNTLDYTRVRKVKGGYGDYSSRCHDIGDASFCH